MSANLPPAYHEAERRFRAASTPETQVAALEEMLRLIPKHKGTEKLQATIKSRISKLKHQPAQKGGTRSFGHHVPHEGAGQVALIGPPNAGKSSLVARLTDAPAEVAEYPFTTREVLPAMMPYEDIAFQLLDLPPLSKEHVEPWVYDVIRQADLFWLVVDQSNSLDQLEETRRLLRLKHIEPVPWGGTDTEIERGVIGRPSLLVVTGLDRPESAEDLEILEELLEEPWPTLAVSSLDGSGLEELGKKTFEALEIIRVYTKRPGKPADRNRPFTLPHGATIRDLARTIHKDLVEDLKSARVWGANVFDGQTVQRDHVLEEGDIVEIHM